KNMTGVGKHRRNGPSATSELVIHEQPTSHVAEAVRSIRTNILFMNPDHPLRTLLVTSAGVGEGKTTIACCTAIVMAQAGKRVILVDCDLRRPRLHRIFKKPSNVGLTTALLEGDTEGVIVESGVPNLSLTVCGPIPPNPAELLQSERFKQHIAKLTEQFDHVILDSSPLMAVTDAAILSTLVDRTMLVVRAFQTRKDFGQRAVRTLVDVGAKLAGVVLNAVDFNRGEYRYAYSYYRRYSNYGPDPREPKIGAHPPTDADADAPPPPPA
ncbi:MAG TPA: CpsD/CapB family tyrosine-protein kinase, partial [Byssovorax sp.]